MFCKFVSSNRSRTLAIGFAIQIRRSAQSDSRATEKMSYQHGAICASEKALAFQNQHDFFKSGENNRKLRKQIAENRQQRIPSYDLLHDIPSDVLVEVRKLQASQFLGLQKLACGTAGS